jgi:PPM family protein phosphatase
MIIEKDFAARQIQGGRPYQEDFYAFSSPKGPATSETKELILAMADGMGGHCAGDYASHFAVEGFLQGFHQSIGKTSERLRFGLEGANGRIASCMKEFPHLIADMGTTLIGLATNGEMLEYISVGDSLIYLYRDGKIKRVNEDHSLAPILSARVSNGLMTAEEAAHHPDRSTLRSAIVGDTIELIDHPNPIRLKPGDVILVATDGILSLPDSFIQNRLAEQNKSDAATIAETLLRDIENLANPRQDNTTVALIKFPSE